MKFECIKRTTYNGRIVDPPAAIDVRESVARTMLEHPGWKPLFDPGVLADEPSRENPLKEAPDLRARLESLASTKEIETFAEGQLGIKVDGRLSKANMIEAVIEAAEYE